MLFGDVFRQVCKTSATPQEISWELLLLSSELSKGEPTIPLQTASIRTQLLYTDKFWK